MSAGSEAQCAGQGGIYLPGSSCAADACGPGACCFETSCNIADAFSCIAAGREFAGAGTTCLDDPCAAGIGACCFDTGACDDLSPTACTAGGGVWQGAGTDCTEPLCDPGACCLPGECQPAAHYECDASGGAFIPGGACDDACLIPLGCPANALYSQPRDPPSAFTAYTSEATGSAQRHDNFAGAAGAVEGVVWWGLDLDFTGNGFVECAETDPTFLITFSTDLAGAPGDPACSFTAQATRTPTGVFYLGFELNEYTLTLPEPCVLVEGWLSIVGLGDPECWFLWMSSSVGDGFSSCTGCQEPLEDSDLAFCLIGAAGGVAGACCDQSTGGCDDGTDITDCLATGLRFEPDETCATIEPPCQPAPGACCFDDGTACAALLPVECIAAAGDWIGAAAPCSSCPAYGACCFDEQSCAPLTQAQCADGGFTWLGPGSSCERCPDLPACRRPALFAQPPDGPGDFLAGTSEQAPGLVRSEDFAGATGAIEALTWWGLDLEFVPPGSWIECVESDPTFHVTFRTDAAGVPGAVVCTYTLLATRTPLPFLYLGAQLNEYRVTLPQPCVLVNGWVSIAGAGDPSCWFLWMSAGTGSSYCAGCTPEPQDIDLALCLEGEAGGVFGACCDDDTGSCMERVEITACGAGGLRFLPGGACDELDPPCGVLEGACCQGDGTCDVQAAATCAAAGGSWLGPFSICRQCPCVAFCPPGGHAEGEPVCDEEFVDLFNGGCNEQPALFSPIEPGDTVCGTSGVFQDGEAADFDWYQVQVGTAAGAIALQWTVVAEFPAAAWILDGSDGCPGTIVTSDIAEPCAVLRLDATVEPGTYWMVVAPAAFSDSAACGTEYTATLGADQTCLGDVDGSGAVDVQDLVAVVLAWGSSDPAADVNGDGTVDVQDLVAVIVAWGPCT
jgi:hypothetical protein